MRGDFGCYPFKHRPRTQPLTLLHACYQPQSQAVSVHQQHSITSSPATTHAPTVSSTYTWRRQQDKGKPAAAAGVTEAAGTVAASAAAIAAASVDTEAAAAGQGSSGGWCVWAVLGV